MIEHESSRNRALSDPAILMAIFERSLDAMLLVDESGVFVDVNPAACKLLGLPRERLIGRTSGDFTAPEFDRQGARRTFQEQGFIRGEAPFTRADGVQINVEFAVSPMAPGLYLCILRDVTDRQAAIDALRKSELSLRKNEARFRALIEKSKDAVTLAAADGTLLYVSPGAERIFGWTPTELIGKSGLDLVHPEDRPAVQNILLRLIEHPSESIEAENRIVHRDGSIRWVEVTVTNLLSDPAIGAIVGNFSDITERRAAHLMTARMAAIVEYSDDAIMGSQLDGTIVAWNQAAERLYGWPAHEIIGKSAGLFLPHDRRAELGSILDRLRSGLPVNHLETVRLRKDGSLFDIALTLSPVRDALGNIVGVAAIGRDLTERRRAEAALRATEEQLRQAQKLEAVGTLAGGIAHDFNNLLSVILTYSATMARDLVAGDPMRIELEEIEKAAKKASELTRQLLAFGRRQILRPTVVDLNRVVSGMERILRRLLAEHIELTLLLAPGLDRTLADPGQMEQVIMNLVVNARDAMPNGGKVTIETTNVSLSEKPGSEGAAGPSGPHVLLIVSDTGDGMDEATRLRIFEPFFTTKKDKGTGLGLATVFGIVKQSGGHIWVTSEPGRGTTFKVALQATQASRSSSTSVPPAETIHKLRGSETILLVEDDEQVRSAVRNVLRRSGYHVLEAGSPGDALLVSEQHTGFIHLLLTDVIMPRMTGPELAERLLVLRSGLRVLYMSGYADRSFEREGLADRGFAFLQKPLTPDRILGKVREVIDSVEPRVGVAPELTPPVS